MQGNPLAFGPGRLQNPMVIRVDCLCSPYDGSTHITISPHLIPSTSSTRTHHSSLQGTGEKKACVQCTWIIRHSERHSTTTQHNTTQHNTTQHYTTQHNTTQHNTKHQNTTQNTKTQILRVFSKEKMSCIQEGFELMTSCSRGVILYMYHGATEAAQLAEFKSPIQVYKVKQSSRRRGKFEPLIRHN